MDTQLLPPPTETYLQFLEAEVAKRERAHPTRTKVMNYLKQKNKGANESVGQQVLGFVSRLSEQGVMQVLKQNAMSTPPTLGELEAWKLTLDELVADEGAALSLHELQEAKLVVQPHALAHLLRLKPTASTIFGPFSSPARRTRLNPAVVVACLGKDIRGLLQHLFPGNEPPLEVMLRVHAVHLDPADFDALQLRFDDGLMKNAKYRQIIAPQAIAVFQRWPFQTWRSQAGLTKEYVRSMFPPNTAEKEMALRLKWTDFMIS